MHKRNRNTRRWESSPRILRPSHLAITSFPGFPACRWQILGLLVLHLLCSHSKFLISCWFHFSWRTLIYVSFPLPLSTRYNLSWIWVIHSLSSVFNVYLFWERERECMNEKERVSERGRERIPSRLHAVITEPKCGARSHKLWDHDSAQLKSRVKRLTESLRCPYYSLSLKL